MWPSSETYTSGDALRIKCALKGDNCGPKCLMGGYQQFEKWATGEHDPRLLVGTTITRLDTSSQGAELPLMNMRSKPLSLEM
jgi:hypothetical protein